ncbi:MAG TPA: Gfo/Idh/MocA family oxidoreductase [Streptosporangiaceae bacterium]|nr:Gfo/Idh/MocA family oxidoreductase [Streptosporangiaceae bacterium]
MTAPAHQVIVVGLGEIARTHLAVLEQIPDADVVAGIDIASRPGLTFRGRPVPVYATPARAARDHQPGIVVIATPTPTHAAVCDDVAAAFPAARILVEKPADATLAGARHVIASVGARHSIDIAYHMSFSPEVEWGLEVTRARAGQLGNPVAITASFTDPYCDRAESARARYGSSWIDSGINALSIVHRFVTLTGRISLRGIGDPSWSAYEGRFACRTAGGGPADALIVTSWHVTEAAKTTTIAYDSGAELVLDHTAVAAYLIAGRQVEALFGAGASVPRRERHYRALYRSWLTDGKPIATPQVHLLLHDLLLQPAGPIGDREG